jgi:hypothetical protein
MENKMSDFNVLITRLLTSCIEFRLEELATRVSDNGYTLHLTITKDEYQEIDEE